VLYETGGTFVSLTKKSRAETKLIAFHSTIYKLTVILLKVDHEFFVLG
jgi:hypothetical protein